MLRKSSVARRSSAKSRESVSKELRRFSRKMRLPMSVALASFSSARRRQSVSEAAPAGHSLMLKALQMMLLRDDCKR